MARKWIPLHEIKYETTEPPFQDVKISASEPEQLLLALIQNAQTSAEHYFAFLHYGEWLTKMGSWEEASDFLTRSARVALEHQVNVWLVLSHEKLGDLSAAEEDWFGALHHYRYAIRNAVSVLDPSILEKLKTKAKEARNSLNAVVLAPNADTLPLSKEYGSGNMAISFVQRDIFLKKYFARCLECNFCFDACCSYGADINIQNVEKILNHKEGIQPFIRPSTVEWFEKGYTYESEYDGNLYTRINPQGARCVFLNHGQRGCGLHSYAISKGMDYHEIKPLMCTLFPLSFGEGVLCLAPELDDDSLVCSGAGDSAYRSLRNELEYYFGHALVEELDVMEKEVLSRSR